MGSTDANYRAIGCETICDQKAREAIADHHNIEAVRHPVPAQLLAALRNGIDLQVT